MSPDSVKGIFITGTDTEVGKTFVGVGLVAALKARGADVQPRKPVESGCLLENGVLVPADGSLYRDATAGDVSLDLITPYRLHAALSPKRAAVLEDKDITIDLLCDAVNHGLSSESLVVVEGAGGFYSPLALDGLNADLARRLAFPVLLVVADRLGCINHTLLSIEAIKGCGLQPAGIVLSGVTDSEMENAPELGNRTGLPVWTVPKYEKNINYLPESDLLPMLNLLFYGARSK